MSRGRRGMGVSLRTRLTVWYGALLALTLLGFSTLLYFTLERSLLDSVDATVSLRADSVRRALGPNLDTVLQPEDVAPGSVQPSLLDEFTAPGVYVQVLNARGAVVYAPPNLLGGELPIDPASLAGLKDGHSSLVTLPLPGSDAGVRVRTLPVIGSDGSLVGAVQVGQSLSPEQSTMTAVTRLLFTAGGAALLIALVVGWLITRGALSPVARMTETARHIAETGDYHQRLAVPQPWLARGDELLFMATTFNAMIERLDQVLESQRRLLADTSHELRNPLTVIRGNLALLRRPSLPPRTHQEAVLEAEEEAARMGRLVDDLLLLARMDAGDGPKPVFQAVDLLELATGVVEQARGRAGARELSVSGQGALVSGDRDRLKQLLANLVDNAIRYTPETGHVMVWVHTEPAAMPEVQQGLEADRSSGVKLSATAGLPVARILVQDTGVGIAAQHLPHVFDRFYRADKARSRADGGTGLGLAIAQSIVQAHGGSIMVSSDGQGQGTTFTVTVPLLAEAQTLEAAPEPMVDQAPRPAVAAALAHGLGRGGTR